MEQQGRTERVAQLKRDRKRLRRELEAVRAAECTVADLGGACLAQLSLAVDLLAIATGKPRDHVAAVLSEAARNIS